MKKILLGSILHMTKGKKPKEQAAKQEADFLPYVDIKAFEKRIIENYVSPEKCLLCQDGDVLIVCDGARSGLVGRAMAGVVGSTLALISADGCSNDYLFYFLQSLYVLLNSKQKGTGTPHLNPDILKKAQLVVPPLPEQERIVAKIEELFSQLDAAVAELKSVKEKLVIYRQAVLKEAFEGKLTESWRKNNPQPVEQELSTILKQNVVFKDISGDSSEYSLSIPSDWKKIRLGSIFNVDIGGTPSRSNVEYWGNEIPWVSSGEVHFNLIDKTNEKITNMGLKKSSAKLQPAGTVLLAMIGEGKTRGQAAVLKIDAAHNQNIAAILVSQTPCSSKFIYYYFFMIYEYTRRVGSGNNQKALNKERVKAIHIPFTSFEEQKKIVQNIEEKLSVCNNIEQTVDIALQQATALRQSILKQAFEGNL